MQRFRNLAKILLPYFEIINLIQKYFRGSIISYSVFETGKVKSSKEDFSDVGIIIQGPLLKRKNFTIKSIKYYLNSYPGVRIYLSTWDTIDKHNLKNLKKLPITVILNKKPANTGRGNVFLQIKTTTVGLEAARIDKCKYVAKVRSDQGFFENYALQLLKSIVCQKNVNSKIVTTYFNTIHNRDYSISDHFQFGEIDSIYSFWNGVSNKLQIHLIPEIHLTSRYYTKLNMQNISYFEFLKTYFILINENSIGLVWFKSTIEDLSSRRRRSKKFEHFNDFTWREITK